MAKKPKGTYTDEVLRIVNTPPHVVAKMPASQQVKYQNAQVWFREQERNLEEAAKAAHAAKMPKTARQIAKWLNLRRKQLADSRSNARAAAEAKATDRAANSARTSQAAAATATAMAKPVKITRQVAKFLWMPQLNVSARPYGYARAWLIQAFAEAFISAGLLPPDHPAQTLDGAIHYKVGQILAEARRNLPPLGVMWRAFMAKTPDVGLVAARQYAVFGAVIALMVTAAGILVKTMAGVVFGTAYALAASVGGGGGMTSGSFVPSGDLASSFIDTVFGGSNSVISSGLGSMFAMYSNTVLVFAGLIVLWIIISAVAETARSGVPGGKQFNHIWAPIRLIVALGLLVPLGSGLNSGQYMIITLAKWGSTQASALWGSFADHMMISTSANASGGTTTSVNGALNAVPLSLSSTRNVADQAFDMMLCQALQNAYYSKYASVIPNASNMMISHSSPIRSQTPAGQSMVSTSGATAAPIPAENVYSISFGRTTDNSGNPIVDANNNPSTDASCGTLSVKIPTSSPGVTVQSAADLTKSAILTDQSNDLANLVSASGAGYQLAQQVANSAIAYVTGPGTSGPAYDWNSWGAMTKQNLATQYAAYVNGYVGQRTQSVANELTNYGTGLMSNLNGGGTCAAGTIGCNLQSDTKTYGWASAAMWLNAIASQNGEVMSVLDSSTPVMNAAAAGPTAAGNGELMDAWNAAKEVEAGATTNTGVGYTPTTKHVNEMMVTALQELTKPSANPLGDLPAIGRDFMATGVRLIAPPNVASCVNDPSQIGCDWVLADMAKANGGGILTPQQATTLLGESGSTLTNEYRKDVFQGDVHGTLLPSGARLNLVNQLITAAGNDAARPFMVPVGLVMISFGLTLGYILALLPYTRFMLGILNWMMQLFESLLAIPLLTLRLLRTDGEGFAPQEFMSGLIMILGLVLRPGLMIFGLVCSLMAFNGIYQIVATTFLPTVLNLSGFGGDSDDSVISSAAYIIFYGTFAYTLGNSAFKLIDLLPNYVMGWLGQRGESRTDDASIVQQTAGGYMQTMAYSMPRGPGGGHAGGTSGGAGAASGNQSPNIPAGVQPSVTPSATSAQSSPGSAQNTGNVGGSAGPENPLKP